MMLALTAKTQARTATKIIQKNKKATREVVFEVALLWKPE
jgi:hypothetical protein